MGCVGRALSSGSSSSRLTTGDTEGTENSHGEQQEVSFVFLRASMCSLCLYGEIETLVGQDTGSVRSLAEKPEKKNAKDTKKMMRGRAD